MFQFTRPQGARRAPGGRRRTADRFNSRARKGRDEAGVVFEPVLFVSIHAPARGATFSNHFQAARRAVSIHAPARGATCFQSDPTRFAEFQFTRPQGARHRLNRLIRLLTSFNSRARKGRDMMNNLKNIKEEFQFTRPQGARQGRTTRPPRTSLSFNSRARKGRDETGRPRRADNCSFNSRARKGRDPSKSRRGTS